MGEQNESFICLWRLWVILTAATFCLEFTVVLATSNAHAQLLELGRHSLSVEPTAMDLIMSHIEFEYLTCSLTFLFGILSFMLATLCRWLAMFKIADSRRMAKEPEVSDVVTGMMLCALFWWIHLANSRYMEFPNVGAMVHRYGVLVWARVCLNEIGVMGSLSLTLFFVTVARGVCLVGSPLWCWLR